MILLLLLLWYKSTVSDTASFKAWPHYLIANELEGFADSFYAIAISYFIFC